MSRVGRSESMLEVRSWIDKDGCCRSQRDFRPLKMYMPTITPDYRTVMVAIYTCCLVV